MILPKVNLFVPCKKNSRKESSTINSIDLLGEPSEESTRVTSSHYERHKRRMDNLRALEVIRQKGYKVCSIRAPYHFRINDILDIYTTNNRYHIIGTERRGSYVNVEEVIDKVI